jgi:ferric enterobactin receptor
MNISAIMWKPGALYTCLMGLISNKLIIRQVMRISVVVTLIILTTLQVLLATATKGQDMHTEKVTIGLNHEDLLSALKKIEKQTSLRFYYRRSDVQTLSDLTLATDSRTVEKTLEALLKKTGFTFRQIDRNILLEKKQQTDYTITGRVTGVDHKPVELATLRIAKVGTTKIISTTLADTSGKFNIIVYEQGDYLLTVSAVKTDSLTMKITVGDSKMVELKDIVLKSVPYQLATVNISGSRPLIRQEADRIIYDLQADPQSKVSSVLDMMRKVPYLSVDGDDNILLKGSSGYRVFINGKPSAMVERNPKDVLRSIPASTIKSIEVITTPPSRYDAEGLAGIINIITNKDVANGYHGSVNINEKWPVGGPGAGGAFTFKAGKFGLSTLAGISRNNIPETSGELTRVTTGTDPTNLEQHSTNQSNSHTGYAGLELSYELDSLNLISGQFNWNSSKQTGLAFQTSMLAGSKLQQYNLANDNNSKGRGLDAAINYQLGFKANKDQLLTISYRYLKNSNSLFNNIDVSNEINYNDPDYHQTNAESLTEHTVQADYVQPIGKIIMEAGLKGIFRKNKSDFQYLTKNPLTGNYDLDQTGSNIFNNSQDVLAAYNSYSYQAAKWQFKAGIRAEETIINGDYSQGNDQIQQRYLNVLPSIVANRKFNDLNSLSFSYSIRIQRPAISQLNPFINRSNPNFETSGNPNLKPITSTAFQLSYLKSGKLTYNIALGYLYFNQVINAFSSFNPATNVTLTRFENYGKGRVLKSNIYISYQINDHWSVNLNTDIRHVTFYGLVNNVTIKNSAYDAYAYASSGYSFKNGWRANADFTYRKAGILLPLGRTNGFRASSFSVNKDIFCYRSNKTILKSKPAVQYIRHHHRKN